MPESSTDTSDRALLLTVETDRTTLAQDLLAAGGERVHFVVDIHARASGVETARAPLSAIFAVDVSGSMGGPPLEQVIRSVERLVDFFEPTDRLGLVAFSDGATEMFALAPMDDANKRVVRSRARRMAATGGTNVEAGLVLAAKMLPARAEHERQIVLLLSDGAPNVGAATADALAEVVKPMRPGITVSSLGYGAGHQEDILAAISTAGAGRYHFIPDPATCQIELAQALGSQGDVVAEALELTVVPAAGVEIVGFVGGAKPRFSTAGLVLPLPDMLDGGRHLVVIEAIVKTSGAERLSLDLLTCRLGYRRAGKSAALEETASVSGNVTKNASVLEPRVHAKVLLARCDEVRAQARALADRGQFDGAAATLRTMLETIRKAPGYVAGDGSQLSEAYELLLDEAVAMERRPSAEAYGTFRKNQMKVTMTGSGADVSSSAYSKGARSRMMMASVGGALPIATLTVIEGKSVGVVHVLGAQNTIGRTQNADICLMSDGVSRRHTDVFALEGEFWVADLGSTNATIVNGKRLANAPHKLSSGDILEIGDVKLRYDEKKDNTKRI
jgi:Ca-activated chloride channel family protein